jgi:Winged helix domain, variant
MKSGRRAAAFGRMLDLCDDLQRIRSRMSDPQLGRDERTRLRRQTQRKVEQLARNLADYRFRGPLGRVIRKYRFDAEEFQVLSVLLQRSVRAEEPEMEGRLILSSIFETSFGVLAGLHLLHEDARLRSSGLVALAEDQEPSASVLETRFRLSDDALAAVRAEVEGGPAPSLPRRSTAGYQNHREFLLDLRLLHNLYRERSEQVFAAGQWDRMYGTADRVGRALSRRIDSGWRRVRERLQATPSMHEFPIIRLVREHGLDDVELMIVVHLLFQELYSGEAFANTVDLLRLVSAGEDELIKNRRYLVRDARLLLRDILKIEDFVEGRELTGEAHLAGWVVNDMLASGAGNSPIKPDERLRWHLYLKSLEDTSGFYRDLESS